MTMQGRRGATFIGGEAGTRRSRRTLEDSAKATGSHLRGRGRHPEVPWDPRSQCKGDREPPSGHIGMMM